VIQQPREWLHRAPLCKHLLQPSSAEGARATYPKVSKLLRVYLARCCRNRSSQQDRSSSPTFRGERGSRAPGAGVHGPWRPTCGRHPGCCVSRPSSVVVSRKVAASRLFAISHCGCPSGASRLPSLRSALSGLDPPKRHLSAAGYGEEPDLLSAGMKREPRFRRHWARNATPAFVKGCCVGVKAGKTSRWPAFCALRRRCGRKKMTQGDDMKYVIEQ